MSEQLEPLATEAGQQAIVRAINNLSSLEYAVRAEHAATEAAQSADEALTSATNASDSETKARDWAEKTSGAVETETIITPPETEGDPPTEELVSYFSAKYWAQAAQDYLNQMVLDTVPTEDSTNGITSGAVYDALATKQDTLTFDNAPTQNSVNPVKSGGVYSALAGKQDTLTIDSTPTQNSTNPVQSGGVYTALSNVQSSLTFDDAPTSGSNNPVKSGGIYTALSGKQDTLTIDSAPTQNSTNPVQSGGVYTAIANATPSITTDTEPTEDSENLITSGAVWEALQNFTPSGGGEGSYITNSDGDKLLENKQPGKAAWSTYSTGTNLNNYDLIKVVGKSSVDDSIVFKCIFHGQDLIKYYGAGNNQFYTICKFETKDINIYFGTNSVSLSFNGSPTNTVNCDIYGIKLTKTLSEQMYSNVLYENSSGWSSGNITLSDSLDNYDFIEFIYNNPNDTGYYLNRILSSNEMVNGAGKYSMSGWGSRVFNFQIDSPTSLTFLNRDSYVVYKIIGYKMAKGGYSGIVSDARMTVKSGTAIFTSTVPNEPHSSISVVFDSPMPDTNYLIFLQNKGEISGSSRAKSYYTNKTVNGFTLCAYSIQSTVTIGVGLEVNWIAIRPNSYTREGMVEDILYTTPTGFTTGTINLSGNISDYDLIEFVIGDSIDGEKYTNNRVYSSSVLTNIMGQQNKFFHLAYYNGGWQMLSVDSDNQLSCSNRSGNTVLYKITGIKFGRYVSGVAVDTTVTQNSDAVVTSGAVYDALQNVAPSITIDSSVTQNGTNAVSGSAVYTAIQSALNSITNANGVSY